MGLRLRYVFESFGLFYHRRKNGLDQQTQRVIKDSSWTQDGEGRRYRGKEAIAVRAAFCRNKRASEIARQIERSVAEPATNLEECLSSSW